MAEFMKTYSLKKEPPSIKEIRSTLRLARSTEIEAMMVAGLKKAKKADAKILQQQAKSDMSKCELVEGDIQATMFEEITNVLTSAAK